MLVRCLAGRAIPEGVTNLIVYLCLAEQHRFDELRPRKYPEYGIAGICPFMMAETIISLSGKWTPRGGIALGAPAEPFLMMASIADWASALNQSVRFQYLNYSCLMSNAGVEIETDDLSMVHWIDCDNQHPLMIELTDDRPQLGYRQLKTVKLPEARLRGNDALYLGD